MYKILYVYNSVFIEKQFENVPENFGIEYKSLDEISNIDQNQYDLCLLNLDNTDDVYIENIKKLIKSNKNINFWSLTKNCTKDDIMFLSTLGLNNYLTLPINYQILEKNIIENRSFKNKNPIFEQFEDATILIVEDNEINLSLIKESLSVFKTNIYGTVSSFEALDLIKTIKFDIMIINVEMPEINGYNILKQAKASILNSYTPFIFVSSLDIIENKILAYSQGASGYFEKPININDFRSQIFGILKLRNLRNNLYKEREKLNNIMNFSSDEIILTDINFQITSSNGMILKNCKNYKSFLQYNFENYFHFIESLETFKAQDNKVLSMKSKINLNDKIYYLSINITKVFDHSEKLTGFVIIMRDITEENLVQEQKEAFIATLTHDLRTPIRAQLGALKILLNEKENLSENQSSILEELYISCDFMKNMTDNILLKYKHDQGKLKINKSLNNLKTTINKVCSNLKFIISQKSQLICVNYLSEIETFNFDSIEIERVINNLLINASEYSHADEIIYLDVNCDKNCIYVSITNTGIDIALELQDKIFEALETTAKKYRKIGSGLGLYISKKIIEEHGGKIQVRSSSDLGTQFTFSLPYINSYISNDNDINNFLEKKDKEQLNKQKSIKNMLVNKKIN